jgi:hypothetical protein
MSIGWTTGGLFCRIRSAAFGVLPRISIKVTGEPPKRPDPWTAGLLTSAQSQRQRFQMTSQATEDAAASAMMNQNDKWW